MNTIILSLLDKLKHDLYKNASFWSSISSWESFEEYVAAYFSDELKDNQIIKSVTYKKGSNVFPDIVIKDCCDNKIGLEVKLKSSISAGWKTLGGSVYETSKRSEFNEIYLVFGHKVLEELKYKDFYESIIDIKVTHSPRYFLDINTEKSFFESMNISSDEPDQIIYEFKNRVASKLTPGQSLWWVDSNNQTSRDEFLNLTLKPWSSLKTDEKNNILVKLMIIFPEVFNYSKSMRYKRIPEFLIKQFGVYNSSLRDIFSAGGKRNIFGVALPAIYGRMFENANKIREYFKMTDLDVFEKSARYEEILNWWGYTSETFNLVPFEDLENEWLRKIETHAEGLIENNGFIIKPSDVYFNGLS